MNSKNTLFLALRGSFSSNKTLASYPFQASVILIILLILVKHPNEFSVFFIGEQIQLP